MIGIRHPKHPFDSLNVKRADGVLIKMAVSPYGLVVMCEDMNHHQTESIPFAEHPELMGIYDDGWVLPEVIALCDSIEIKSVRLPK